MQCFDTLLEYLLNEISFRSNAGASVSDFEHLVKDFYAEADAKKVQKHPDQQDEDPNSKSKAPMGTDRRILERVWKWLLAHPEVNVRFECPGSKYAGRKPLKKLSLAEAETLDQNVRSASPSTRAFTGVRLSTIEERLWIAVAGHEKDEKRLPASEFQLLTAIAAFGPKGVIQPDLVAYSGQDKRSVPRRTDVLRDKGYIVKDHVLSHGARTSICHLKRWKKSESQPHGLNPNFGALKPIIVQGTIHFDNLLDSIFQQLEVNNVVWLNDLKRNLGIASNRWACRAVMRTLHELNIMGCVKRILCQQWESAQLGRERWLRCVRLEREFTEQDRERFHSVWRCADRVRSLNTGVEGDGSNFDVGEDKANEDDEDGVEEITPVQIQPQWSPDVSLSHFLFNMIEASGVAGIGSKEIHLRGIGDFYTRPLHDLLTRITETWHQSQPPHLLHLAIIRDNQLLNRASYFVYRTYENFQKAVDLNQAAWDVATSRAHSGKSGASRNVKPPAKLIKRGLESVNWDEWGFPKFSTAAFINSDGLATVQEAEKLIPLSTRSADVDTFIKFKQGEFGRPFVPGKRGRPRKYSKGEEPYRPKRLKIAMAAAKSQDELPTAMQDTMTTQQVRGTQNPFEVLDTATRKRGRLPEPNEAEEEPANALNGQVEGQPQPTQRLSQSIQLRDPIQGHDNTQSDHDPRPPPQITGEPPVKTRGRPPKKKRKVTQRKATNSSVTQETRKEDRTEGIETTIQSPAQNNLQSKRDFVLQTHGWTVMNAPPDSTEHEKSEQPPVTPVRPRKKQRLSRSGFSVVTASSAPNTPDRPIRSRKKSQKTLDAEEAEVLMNREPDSSELAEKRSYRMLINPPGSQLPRKGRGRPKKQLMVVFRSGQLQGRDLASDPLPRLFWPEPTINSETQPEPDEPVSDLPQELPNHDQSSVERLDTSIPSNQAEFPHPQDPGATGTENRQHDNAGDKELPSTLEPTEEISHTHDVEEMIQDQLREETQQDSRQASPPSETHEPSTTVIEDGVEVGVIPDDSIPEKEFRQPNLTQTSQLSGYLVSKNPQQGRGSRNPDDDTLGNPQPGKLLRLRVDVIMEIIDSSGGAFPGYNETYQPFLKKWAEHNYPKLPDRATVNRAIKGEIDAGRLRKITFVFQDKRGIQVTRWILTRPEIAPTSQLVQDMQAKIRELHPKQYLPGFEPLARQTRQPQYKEFVKEDFFLSNPDKPFYLKRLEERMNETRNKKRPQRTDPDGSRRLARLNNSSRRRQNRVENTGNHDEDHNGWLLTPPYHRSVEPTLPFQFVEDSDARPHLDSREADMPDDGRSEDSPDVGFSDADGRRVVIYDPNLCAPESRGPQGPGVQELGKSNEDGDPSLSRPSNRGQPLSTVEKDFMKRLMQPLQVVNPSTGTYSTDFAHPISRGRRGKSSLRPHVQSVFEAKMPTSLDDMFDKLHTRTRAAAADPRDANFDNFSREVERVARWEQKQLDSDNWMLNFKLPSTRFINHSFYGSMPTATDPARMTLLPKIVNYTTDASLIQNQSTPQYKIPRQSVVVRRAEKPADKVVNRPSDRPLRGPGSRGGKIRPPPNRHSSLPDIGSAHSNSLPVKQFEGTRLTAKSADRLLMSVTVVRCLAGGDDMLIPWGLVLQAWSRKQVSYLQEQWTVLEKTCASQLTSLMRIFQDTFLKAYERGEVPAIDYNNLESYNWKQIVEWALVNVSLEKPTVAQLPAERAVLDKAYTLESTALAGPEKEKYYRENTLRSEREKDVHKLFLYTPVTMTPLSHKSPIPTLVEDRLIVAISWLRATVVTPNELYDANTARLKLETLGPELRNLALSRLLNNKTIVHHNKRRITPGRNFKMGETVLQVFIQLFRVQISLDQFREAAAYKKKLDRAFSQEEDAERSVEFKRHNSDGAAMAIDNLAMGRRVKLVPRLPPIDNDIFATQPRLSKWGLTERNYRSNQMPREKLYWPVDVVPTATYVTANPLDGIHSPENSTNPFPEPPGRPSAENPHDAIPIWYSIHGHLLPKWWQRTVALVLGFTSTRPGTSGGEIHEAIKGHLWPWELGLALQWLETIRAVVRTEGARGREARGEVPPYTTGEFWWLGVDAATRACDGRTQEGATEPDAGEEGMEEEDQAEAGWEDGEAY